MTITDMTTASIVKIGDHVKVPSKDSILVMVPWSHRRSQQYLVFLECLVWVWVFDSEKWGTLQWLSSWLDVGLI